jgi:hypothetical protein
MNSFCKLFLFLTVLAASLAVQGTSAAAPLFHFAVATGPATIEVLT